MGAYLLRTLVDKLLLLTCQSIVLLKKVVIHGFQLQIFFLGRFLRTSRCGLILRLLLMWGEAVSHTRFFGMMGRIGNLPRNWIFASHDQVESMLDFGNGLFIFNIVVFGCDPLPFRLGSRWGFIWYLAWSSLYLGLNPRLNIVWLSSLMVVHTGLFRFLSTHFIINWFLMSWLFNCVANSSLNLTVNKIFKLVLFLNTFTGRHLIYIMVVIRRLKNHTVVIQKLLHLALCMVLVNLMTFSRFRVVVRFLTVIVLFRENLLEVQQFRI